MVRERQAVFARKQRKVAKLTAMRRECGLRHPSDPSRQEQFRSHCLAGNAFFRSTRQAKITAAHLTY